MKELNTRTSLEPAKKKRRKGLFAGLIALIAAAIAVLVAVLLTIPKAPGKPAVSSFTLPDFSEFSSAFVNAAEKLKAPQLSVSKERPSAQALPDGISERDLSHIEWQDVTVEGFSLPFRISWRKNDRTAALWCLSADGNDYDRVIAVSEAFTSAAFGTYTANFTELLSAANPSWREEPVGGTTYYALYLTPEPADDMVIVAYLDAPPDNLPSNFSFYLSICPESL